MSNSLQKTVRKQLYYFAAVLLSLYFIATPLTIGILAATHGIYPKFTFIIASAPSFCAFCLSFFKWKGLLFLPYVLGVWISLVYLGEHYVVDVLAGALYATLFFFVTLILKSKIKWLNI